MAPLFYQGLEQVGVKLFSGRLALEKPSFPRRRVLIAVGHAILESSTKSESTRRKISWNSLDYPENWTGEIMMINKKKEALHVGFRTDESKYELSLQVPHDSDKIRLLLSKQTHTLPHLYLVICVDLIHTTLPADGHR